jgi:hypothetical protein
LTLILRSLQALDGLKFDTALVRLLTVRGD